MLEREECAVNCLPSSLGMARWTLEESPCGLRRSIFGVNVHDNHRCPFKVVGGGENGLTTTKKTLDVLRNMFACYGLPEQIVSDNGPQFVSKKF